MSIYILFELTLDYCGSEGDKVFDVLLLSVHSNLEKAKNKLKNIINKEHELIKIHSQEFLASNDIELGHGWVIEIKNPTKRYELKYFISEQNVE
jgi:hypothetical protein